MDESVTKEPNDAALEAAIAFVADVCQLPPKKVAGAIALLKEGATIPFIARYRKERTGLLDETQLRAIEDALNDFEELEKRKATILKTIAEQGKLDDALREKIVACRDKRELEEIYLPYKPKRRTRASIARERGLAPLAEYFQQQTNSGKTRDEQLAPFIDEEKDVPDAETAIQGACDILAEQWADDAANRSWMREEVQWGQLKSQVKPKWREQSSKFEMYYDYREPLSKIPSHRLLAMLRGQAEGVLQIKVSVEDEQLVRRLSARLVRSREFIFYRELVNAVGDCFARLLFPSIESAMVSELKEAADEEAIAVFSQNLRELLLAPPAGPQAVIGIDPGFRTGCKVAVVDDTGKFLENCTIFPTPPRSETERASQALSDLIQRHQVKLIAIGNGTASRETDAFVVQVLKDLSQGGKVNKVLVSEAGASVYSASDVAVAEFPKLDVTVRGAISIARRLQDPLAELVKIDPKSIGVGQYQHDVNQTRLRTALDREVSSCVNSVGVDLNTASAPLLSYVAGIGPKLAQAMVKRREESGSFRNRREIAKTPRLGGKAFEQCAGFLRIRNGDEPLDNSAVHPESYYLVKKMAQAVGVTPQKLIGDKTLLQRLKPEQFIDEKTGLPTIRDIISELEKPGRDPRKEFRVAKFQDDVNEIEDLNVGMALEGVVTNVTRFGAFVDIGVHQDGLVHISELDNRFIKDPAEVVSVGDIVRVKVLEIDATRRRIALSRKQLL